MSNSNTAALVVEGSTCGGGGGMGVAGIDGGGMTEVGAPEVGARLDTD